MKSQGTEGVVAQETLRNSDYNEQGGGAASDDESTTTVAFSMVRSPSSLPFCVNLNNTQVQTSSTQEKYKQDTTLLTMPCCWMYLKPSWHLIQQILDFLSLIFLFLVSPHSQVQPKTTNCLMVFFVFLSCCYILIRNSLFI
uniref:Uncharacterized protein n=1 Tax=Triticum urartu TaxID=4572 RepID=A0A8R7V024_TRIUA